MYSYICELQSRICSFLADADAREGAGAFLRNTHGLRRDMDRHEDMSRRRADASSFSEEIWERPEGGGGITRIIQGWLLEKGGVNVSGVYGPLNKTSRELLKSDAGEFAACGLSIVIHPFSPRIPTIHMNIRYFETDKGENWYGGGIDLTPYIPDEMKFNNFHDCLKAEVNSVLPGCYEELKKNCDNYFYLPHRKEMRGISGVFYDHKTDSSDIYFRLNKAIGEAFIPLYEPFLKNPLPSQDPEAEKKFQLFRRGRYAEFNLLYDRGTIFGLKTNGRIESILMSLPPEVHFPYNFIPDPGSWQEKMTGYYQPDLNSASESA